MGCARPASWKRGLFFARFFARGFRGLSMQGGSVFGWQRARDKRKQQQQQRGAPAETIGRIPLSDSTSCDLIKLILFASPPANGATATATATRLLYRRKKEDKFGPQKLARHRWPWRLQFV